MATRLPGTLLLAQDLGLSPTGKRRFAVAGEVVGLRAEALPDAVVGSYPHLLRERQHHVELWEWCVREGLRPPNVYRPSA